MNLTIAAIGVVILALLGFVVWLWVKASKAGADKITARVAEETVDNLRRQSRAEAEARGENVVDRLRRGGF